MKFLPSTSIFIFICALVFPSAPVSAQSTGGIGIQPIVRGGTGATTAAQARLNLGVGTALPGPVFNVRDYGAVLDGTTDDTTAIQNAINAAATAGGGVVYFSGIGKISSALTITSSVGLTLRGGDRNTCGLKASVSTMGALIAITGANVSIESLLLDGVYTTGEHSSEDFGLINLTGATNIRVLSCALVNSRDRCIRLRAASADIEIGGNLFKNFFCAIHSISTAVDASPQRLRIHDNDFRDAWNNGGETGAIKIQSGHTTWSSGHVIADNSFKNTGQMGIECWALISDTAITGNVIEDVAWGISLDHTARTTITSNTIRHFSYAGLEAASLSEDDIYFGNIIIGYTAAGARGGTYGIVTSNNPPHHLQILGNRISGINGSGIQIQTTNDVDISKNFVTDCAIGLTLMGSSRITASGNVITGPVNYHIFIDCVDVDCTDIEISENKLRGNASQDNMIVYDGGTNRTVTRLAILRNNLGGATTSSLVLNLPVPVSRLPYFLCEGNYWTSAGSQLFDQGRYDQLYKPYLAAEQQFSIPVARKFTFTVAASASHQWFKIFRNDYGLPLTMALHVYCNFLSGDNKAGAQTFWTSASPYGQAAGIMKMPDGQYNGGALEGIVYDNPSAGSIHDLWLHFGPTSGGTVTVGGGDYADKWISSPTAVTTEPTWNANHYELNTKDAHASLKSRYIFAEQINTTEQASEPAAPAANEVVIFAVDNGSGKTVLKAKFNTGAAQTLATQPP